MENPFLSQVTNFIQPEFIEALSLNSSDSKENIQKAYNVAIPSLLMKLKDTDSSLLNNLLSNIKSHFTSSSDFQSKLDSVSQLVSSLFGSNYNTLKTSVASYANVSPETSQSVVNSSMLGILDYFKDLSPDFDLSIITNFISSKTAELKDVLPVAFTSLMPSLFSSEVSNFTPPANSDINKVINENEPNQYKTNNSPYKERNDDNGGGGFWKYLIILLIGGAIIYFLYKNCSSEKVVDTTTTTTITTDTISNNPTTNTVTTTTRESQVVTLSDGTTLNAYKGGIEEQLVNFLAKGDYKGMSESELKAIWFDFDYLNFETGSAVVSEDTKVQLDNLAAILKVYPDAKIKIGGYTDKVGNEQNNIKLSTDRANAVKNYLSDKGFVNQIDGAEGYGSEFAKYDENAPEEQRVLDRRVSVSVRNK